MIRTGTASILPVGSAQFFRRRLFELTGAALLIAAGLLLAALISYDPGDPSFNFATDALLRTGSVTRARMSPTCCCMASAVRRWCRSPVSPDGAGGCAARSSRADPAGVPWPLPSRYCC
jgi:hypothetical protein